MIAVMPRVYLDHDTVGNHQAQLGQLVGFGRQRAVWLFGFPLGSPLALAFGIFNELGLWVLAVHSGTVLSTYHGPYQVDVLPAQYRNVIQHPL